MPLSAVFSMRPKKKIHGSVCIGWISPALVVRDEGISESRGGPMSESMTHAGAPDVPPSGSEFLVMIEGVEHPWASDTIAFEDIVRLGGWGAAEGVIEVDEDNRERTLKPGEMVKLKPGHGFSKKVRWRRG
jgi:Multiubiquitin